MNTGGSELKRPLVPVDDLKTGVFLGPLTVAAWALSEPRWGMVAGACGRLSVSIFRGRTTAQERLIPRSYLERLGTAKSGDAAAGYTSAYFEEVMQVMRGYWPGGWQPEIETQGLQHVEDGLAGGRGVILWVAAFTWSSLVSKMALARLGLAVAHLSRPTHGFSRSRLGMPVLNPLRTRMEDRYLGERITIHPGMEMAAMRALRRRLAANGVVSIAHGTAQRMLEASFPGGMLKVPTGPMTLALTSGAPILPVFATRISPGKFRVEIEKPLSLHGEAREDALRGGARAFAAALAERALAHPQQWRGWISGTAVSGGADRA